MINAKRKKIKNDDVLYGDETCWYSSRFWYVIGMGFLIMTVFALMGAFNQDILVAGLRVAPIIIIAAGIDILAFRKSPVGGTVWGLVTLMAFTLLALVAHNQAWGTPATLETTTINYPNQNNYQGYTLTLDSGLNNVRLSALAPGTPDLIDGTMNHYGNLDIETDLDNDQAEVTVAESGMNFFWNASGAGDWTLALNPDVPLTLDVNGGMGTLDLDLTGLHLHDSQFEVGIGSMTLRLPDAQTSYQATIDGGIGEFVLHLPADTPIRIEAKAGIGELTIPDLERISTGNEENPVGDEGIWQTTDFDPAQPHIVVIYDGGIGSFTVHR